MVLLSYARFDQPLEQKQFEDYLSQLPLSIQPQVMQYRRWQDAQAVLLGKLLLQEGARRHFQRDNILADIQYTSWKRPFVEGGLDFNISHAGELVVCVMSDTTRVGIDIEKIVPLELAAYRQQMTSTEWADISGADDPICAFYHYWTRKEAAIKADGRGMGIPLQEVRLCGDSAWIEGQEWHLQPLPVAAGYACCLATEKGERNEGISAWESLFG
jgi:4'-phosphopantetheinyl transferase